MNDNIKTVVFDLGGVLINWDPRNMYRKMFDSERKMEWFLENICTMDWNEEQDAGRTIKEATALLVHKYPPYKSYIEAYYGRWVEMLDGEKTGTVKILNQIKKENKFRLLALTNWSAETFPYALERFSFLNQFEGILVSGEEGMKKPSKSIYDLLFRRYKIKAEESIFIDDSLRNIDAAEHCGMVGIHFQSADQLAERLRDLKILS